MDAQDDDVSRWTRHLCRSCRGRWNATSLFVQQEKRRYRKQAESDHDGQYWSTSRAANVSELLGATWADEICRFGNFNYLLAIGGRAIAKIGASSLTLDHLSAPHFEHTHSLLPAFQEATIQLILYVIPAFHFDGIDFRNHRFLQFKPPPIAQILPIPH